MPRVRDVALDVERLIAESRARFRSGRFKGPLELPVLRDDLDSPSTAARSGLDQNWQAYLFCDLQALLKAMNLFRARDYRNAVAADDLPGQQFIAHLKDALGARPDELYLVLLAGSSQLRPLGEKAVSREDGIRGGPENLYRVLLAGWSKLRPLGEKAVSGGDSNRAGPQGGGDEGLYLQIAVRSARRAVAPNAARLPPP